MKFLLACIVLKEVLALRSLLPHSRKTNKRYQNKFERRRKLQLAAHRYRFTRNLSDDEELNYLEYREALVDGRVLGAGFRKSNDPELWEFGVPARVPESSWLASGLWYESTAFNTGVRVLLPAVLACICSVHFFPSVCYWLAHNFFVEEATYGTTKIVSLSLIPQLAQLIGLVFSVFTNFTFQAMYEQQEAAILAIFAEVSCAKALVEQILLVFGGENRIPNSRCARALRCVRNYCARDLRRRGSRSAQQLRLAIKSESKNSTSSLLQDPLEELLFLSSIGDPSDHVYATVKELRKIRANRLGALERKLPALHFFILYGLQALLLLGFIAESASAILKPDFTLSDLQLQTAVFAISAFALTACLRVLQDIWSPKSGAYNVDAVLVTSVMGLEKQLDGLLGISTPSYSSSSSLEEKKQDDYEVKLVTTFKQWCFPLQQPSPVWASGYL